MRHKQLLPCIGAVVWRAVAILAALVLPCVRAFGQGSGREFPGFRYWKAPEAAIARWPWGDEKYLPIKVERFNEWLRLVEAETRRREYVDGARLVNGVAKLRLDANLVGDALQGSGEIVADVFVKDATSDPEAALFPTPNLSVAIAFDEEDERARLEDQIATYADRNLYLPMRREGARAFLWSKRGKTLADGALQFNLTFPAAADAELSVVTSATESVAFSDGVIASSSDLNDGSNRKIWRAYLGGRSNAIVTVTKSENVAKDERRKPDYRQELNYRIAIEGVELESKWRFENADAPIGEVELEFDEPLAPLAIEWGTARLENLPPPKRDEESGKRRIAIRAPAPIDGVAPDLKLQAFYPLEFARKRTPTVRLVAANARWRESLCRIAIVEPLEPTYVEPVEAVQTRDPARARQDEASVLAFKFYNPNASVILDLEAVETSAPFDSATDCLFVENGISAKTTLFFNFADSNRKTVAIPVAKDWEINSVQTNQGEDFIWKPEPDLERDGCSILYLAFKTLPPPNQPTRVAIAARYKGEIESKILVDSLRPIDLSDALLGAHALVLRSDSTSQVQLASKTGRPYVAAKNKPNFIFGEAQLREATSSAVGAARLYFGDQTVGLYASLERAKTDYSVAPSCFCSITERSLEENWTLRCAPAEGMRVDRVVFFVYPKTDKRESYQGTIADNLPWTWTTATEPDRVNYATLLSREEADALRAPENADAYEIKLPASRSVPFDLKVFYAAPNAPYVDLPLLFFPETSQETAEIVLASNSDQPFKTVAVAMVESTPPIANSTRYGAQTKAFRYRPTEIFETIETENDANESELEDNNVPKISVELLAARRSREELDTLLPYNALCWFENYDSYYQKDGAVDHCATFYIENRGRDYLRFYVERTKSEFETAARRAMEMGEERENLNASYDDEKESLVAEMALEATQRAIRAVWRDNLRAQWFIRNVEYIGGGNAAAKNNDYVLLEITVQIPANQKFVCLAIEYADNLNRPIGGVRLKPFEIRCEAPILSGVWTAWTPPQYITRDRQYLRRASSAPKTWLRAIRNLLKRSSRSEQATVALADLVAERLGDSFTLKTFISDARDADAQAQGRESSALVAPRLDPPTWGDLFGSQAFAERLFAREGAQEPVALRVDQFALARVGVAPSTPAPLDSVLTPTENVGARRENAARLLADAGIVMLFLEDKLALVTTDDALAQWNGLDTVPIQGRAFRRARESGDALAFADELLKSNSKRFVSPTKWRAMVGGTSPWSARSHSLEAKGWERATTPIGRANEGVYFVNRYRLATLALAAFLATLAFGHALWRLAPRYLIAVAGVSCATLFVTHYELASIAKGVLCGACAILLWRVAQGVTTSESTGAEPVDDESHGSTSVATDEDESQLSGFVDFNHMPDDVAQYLRDKVEQATLQNGGAALPEGEVSRPDAARSGKTRAVLLATLLVVACALLAANFVVAQEESGKERDGTLSPQNAIQELNQLFPLSNDAIQPSTNANPSVAAKNYDWREPYRVFVPYDENGNDAGEYYWINDKFYELIRNALRERPRKKNWRVVDALYSGDVSYNSFSKTTSVYQLKATYLVVLDEENATITLPSVQLSANGGAKFDDEVVDTEYAVDANEMSIRVSGKPGRHRLVLSLEPSVFIETANRISAPILPVASARLELNVDLDAPTLDAPNALGAITRTPRKFTAQLGPVDTLVIEKKDATPSDAKSALDVEQYFLMRTRPTQTDLRAAFKFQTVAGKVEFVEIECDPAYSFSGYCKCDAAEIEAVEAPTPQNRTMRVVFKNPAPAAFTLNVDFVARDFAGVGALPAPTVRTKDARTLVNWLAFAESQGVELQIDEESAALETEFMNAWGADDEKVELVYDLDASKLENFSIRLKQALPKLEEDVAYIFRPSYVETQYVADVETESEIFQMTFATPKPFVVDSIAIYDEQGLELDAPDYVVSNDKLRLEFHEPIKGRKTVNIVGRAKANVEQERPFPILRARDVEYVKRTAQLYASPNLYLEWLDAPNAWSPIERDFNPENVAEDVYPFEFYSLMSDSPERADEEEKTPVMRVVMNAPVAQGVERVGLYPTWKEAAQDVAQNGDKTRVWKALYALVFKPIEGRFDKILVRADEQFELDPLPAESIFKVRDAVDLNGTRAYLFEPKRTTIDDKDKEYCLLFSATFRGEQENLRLPNFQLAPSPLLEDYSRVSREALLAVSQDKDEFSWSKRGLAPSKSSAQRLSIGVSALVRNGVSSIIGDAQDENENQPETRDDVKKSDAELVVINFLKKLQDDEGTRVEAYARGANAEANLSSRGTNLEVALAQHSFYINDRREIFGLVSFLIQPGERDRCEIVAPPKCHVLEASVNGARRLVEKQIDARAENDGSDVDSADALESGETKWRVDLGGSPYAKRLVVAFYSESQLEEGDDARLAQRRAEEFNVDFLRVADAQTNKLVWYCAFEDFEASALDAKWSIRATPTGAGKRQSAECEPIALADANPAFQRLAMLNASAILDAYDSDTARLASAQPDDRARLSERWLATLERLEDTLTQYAEDVSQNLEFDDELARAVVVFNGNETVSPKDARVGAEFPVRDWRGKFGDLVALKERLANALKKERGADAANRPRDAYAVAPEKLWALETGANARVVFGSTDAEILSLAVVATPKRFDFFASSYAVALFILMATAFLFQALTPGAARARKGALLACALFVWTLAFFYLKLRFIAISGAFLIVIVSTLLSYARRARGAAPISERELVNDDDSEDDAREFERESSDAEDAESPRDERNSTSCKIVEPLSQMGGSELFERDESSRFHE